MNKLTNEEAEIIEAITHTIFDVIEQTTDTKIDREDAGSCNGLYNNIAGFYLSNKDKHNCGQT